MAPLPLLATLVLGALPIAEFGTDAQRQNLLPGVIDGTVILTAALVESLRLQPIVANTLVVAVMSAVNFFVADRWVFARKKSLVVALTAGGLLAPRSSTAAPPSETLEAWAGYVARAEPAWPDSPGAEAI